MKIEDIEKMSLEEVKERYNDISKNTSNSLSTWEKIYEWKQQDLLNQRLEKINVSMIRLTRIVTILTAVNVVAAVAAVLINFI